VFECGDTTIGAGIAEKGERVSGLIMRDAGTAFSYYDDRQPQETGEREREKIPRYPQHGDKDEGPWGKVLEMEHLLPKPYTMNYSSQEIYSIKHIT
jgi:hypothetical protein